MPPSQPGPASNPAEPPGAGLPLGYPLVGVIEQVRVIH